MSGNSDDLELKSSDLCPVQNTVKIVTEATDVGVVKKIGIQITKIQPETALEYRMIEGKYFIVDCISGKIFSYCYPIDASHPPIGYISKKDIIWYQQNDK